MTHLAGLLKRTHDLLDRAYVPYSRRPESAVVLLSDGLLVPGVRVENASFSLTIDAAACAVVNAVSAGRRDIVAAALSYDPPETVSAYLKTLPFARLVRENHSSIFLAEGAKFVEVGDWLPRPAIPVATPDEVRDQMRTLHLRAFAPESGFPVGCLALSEDGVGVPGVNVEHPDWTRTLCAERAALVSAWAYGKRSISDLYLSCRDGVGCTPCGACRQVILELAPDSSLWMDRGTATWERIAASSLLPGAFYLSLTGESGSMNRLA